MSECALHLTDPALVHRCERTGCRNRATCYHVYYYCDKHCPRKREPVAIIDVEVPEKLRLDEILWHCLRQNVHADESNAAIHCASVRYSPLTFRIAEYLWNHFPSYRGKLELAQVAADWGSYAEDPGR